MARTSPTEFVHQVRQELGRVTWPTRRETLVTTGMVFLMVFIAAAFFFAPLVVEGDELFQDFFIGEVDGPAVGIGNGGMEVVVNLAEDGDGRRLPESGNYVLSVAFAPDPASVLCSNHFCTEVVGAYYCRAAGKLRAREVS